MNEFDAPGTTGPDAPPGIDARIVDGPATADAGPDANLPDASIDAP